MTDHRATATVTTLAPRRPGAATRTHPADITPPARPATVATVLRVSVLSHLLDPGGLRMVLRAVLSDTPVVAEFIDGRRYHLDVETCDYPSRRAGVTRPVASAGEHDACDSFGGWLARHLQDGLTRFTLDADRYRVRVTRCDGQTPAPAADEVAGRASA